ncbi:MAG: tetratricopeptide repeat protein [Azospirillum sp.]|nr:tetratricopeptide repeat protein [Azospirillum sp.]
MERLAEALAAHQAGNLAAARRLYRALLDDRPDHVRALQLLGVVHFQEGDLTGAIRLLDRALAGDPGSASIQRHRGAVLLAADQVEAAGEAFRLALDAEPGDAETSFNLGLVERRLGRLDRAIPLLEQAAAGLAGHALSHYELGLALQLAGRGGAAAVAYRRAVAVDPDHAAAHNNLGVLLQHAGDLEGAVAAFRRATASRPDFVEALSNLGCALTDQGKLGFAAAVLQQALAVAPGHADAWNNLGVVRQRNGDPGGAVAAYRAALQHDPLAERAHENLAECLRELGRDDEALDSLRTAAAARPQDGRVQTLLGRALKRAGDAPAALAAFRIASAAGDVDGGYELGMVLAAGTAPEDGIAHLRRAVAQRPDHPPFQRGLALALLARGDGAGAVAACARALAVDRFDQEALAYQALGHRLAGDTAAADALTDGERWVQVLELGTPPGEPDLARFNHSLAAELRALTSRRRDPTYQSIRGGTQTGNNLFTEPSAAIQAFRTALEQRLQAFMASLPQGDGHPFPAGRPSRHGYRSWSVILESGGWHTAHIHPEGWLSGVYYVEVPEFEDDGDPDAGCLELGRPAMTLPLDTPPPLRVVPPTPGRLVLFPSFFWHGVRPFRSRGERVTIAFDVLPLARIGEGTISPGPPGEMLKTP